jgi:hypothetical protein
VLKDASLVPPIGDQMKIDFPPGTDVMDSIGMQHYLVLSDGKRDYRPFYDVNSGKVISPGGSDATQPAR